MFFNKYISCGIRVCWSRMCDNIENIFEKQHGEISECDYGRVERDIRNIANRVTHIIDCEAYSVHPKKRFLREVSVWCKLSDRVTTYHIFIPNRNLFDENAYTVKYQIRKIHGLPVVRKRLDKDYYLYDEVMYLLRKTLATGDLVGYKGGTIERDLLRGLSLKGFNLELMMCPKYSTLLTVYGVEQRDCGKHLFKGENHCSGHEVQLFGRFVKGLENEKCLLQRS